MNKSQKWATAAFIATIVQTLCASVLPQIAQLPPSWRVVGTILSIIGAAATGLVTLFNQSLSSNHVSVPVTEAIDAGLVKRPSDPGAFKPVIAIFLAVLLFTAPLAGCSQSHLEKARNFTMRAQLALSGAPVLVSSFVEAKLIDEAQAKELTEHLQQVSTVMSKLNTLLLKSHSLDGPDKADLQALIATALLQLDQLETQFLPTIKSEKVRQRIISIVILLRGFGQAIQNYLSLTKVGQLIASPKIREADLARLEELMSPATA